jgi:hypothetical protein
MPCSPPVPASYSRCKFCGREGDRRRVMGRPVFMSLDKRVVLSFRSDNIKMRVSPFRQGIAEYRLDLQKSGRKLDASRTPHPCRQSLISRSSSSATPTRTSRRNPPRARSKWLSFATGYLRPAVKQGAVEIWVDRLMRGGEDWDPEIERKLRACDIFVLLVSHNSMGSDYIVDQEIAVIRDRQAKGGNVHFYPLLIMPTPKIGLEIVQDKNLRPRDAKPLSDHPLYERYQLMKEAADEIAEIATEIEVRRAASSIGQSQALSSSRGSIGSFGHSSKPVVIGSALRMTVGEDGPYERVKGTTLR